jgi:hypothetical protein
VEIEGSINAHIRDAVALCQLWSDIEEGVSPAAENTLTKLRYNHKIEEFVV